MKEGREEMKVGMYRFKITYQNGITRTFTASEVHFQYGQWTIIDYYNHEQSVIDEKEIVEIQVIEIR